MDSIGFTITKDDGQYGKAIHTKTSGMTVINWNREGHSCTYFGERLDDNVSVTIYKDGGTRTAFAGYVFTKEDLLTTLKLTW